MDSHLDKSATAQEFRSREERMQIAQEAARAGTWEWDLVTGEIVRSAELEALYGFPAHESKRTFNWFRTVVHSEDLQSLGAQMAQTVANGTNYHGEFRIRRADGEQRWIEAFGKIFCDAEGTPQRMIGVDFDITERKAMEEALRVSEARHRQLAEVFRESDERLRLALDAADMSTWEWDLKSDSIHWSPNLDHHMDMPEGSFSGSRYRQFLSLVHPEDRERVNEAVMRSIQHGDEYRIEFRMLRPDGSSRWTEARGTVLRDDKNKPSKLLGIDMDITARKQAEQDLRRQQERTEFVADASDVGFWFCDLPFDKIICDRRVRKHLFLPLDGDVTIDMFYPRLHPHDLEATREAIETSIQEGTRYDIEYRTIAPDGSEKWIHAIGQASYDQNGRATHFDGITNDVTKRKKAEAALRESEARYRELTAKQGHARETNHGPQEIGVASQPLRRVV